MPDIRIDLTTGDVITPRAVSYGYRLMFENRIIKLMTYNLETLLAEKLETMIARGTANTRMRDFYDIYLLTDRKPFDLTTLRKAILYTSRKRGTEELLANIVVAISLLVVAQSSKHQLEDNFQFLCFFLRLEV